MRKAEDISLYEQVRHQSEDLPLKFYRTSGVYLHWHKEYEFVIAEKGDVLCFVNGESIPLSQNQALLIHSGDLHSIRSENKAKVRAIVVSPTFWADEQFLPLFEGNIRFQSVFDERDPIDRSIIELLTRIFEREQSRPFARGFLIKADFSEIFSILLTNNRYSSVSDSHRQIPGELKTLMNYVHKHYTEKITLHTLSSLSFYSQSTIIKLFRRYTGFTPAEYITQYRLEIAGEKLRKADESNLTIALSCGFNSETYFIRAFKKRFGITPHAYRKQYTADCENAQVCGRIILGECRQNGIE